MMSYVRAAFCALLLSAVSGRTQEINLTKDAAEAVLFDFDETGLAPVWNKPQGGLKMEYAAGPAAKEELGPQGKALKVSTKAGGFLYTRSGQLPEDLLKCEAATFWVHSKKPATVEVQFIEKGGAAKFWRKTDISGKGWQKIIVPLRYMRWAGKRTPDWRGVQYFGVYFRTAAEIAIDNIAFARSKCGTDIPTPELAALAFPGAAANTIRTAEKDDLRVLTNCSKVDFEALDKLIRRFAAAIRRDLPFLPEKPVRVPTLVVFETQKQYQDFPGRFAAQHNSGGARPTSGGFTFMGIATSFWNPRYGTKRPVYGHEFLHAYIELLWGFSSGSGDWIQEGLANHYQIQIHPQKGFEKIVMQGVKRPTHHLPLKKLCSGGRIPLNRYWQALTVTRMLLETEPYKGKLKEIFVAFRRNGTTNMDPVLKQVLNRSWNEFDQDWREFCRTTYGQ